MRIAFGHKAQVGKDTGGLYLKDKYMPNAKIIKFADPLYEIMYMIQNYLGLPNEKDRKLLQWIGTDYGRSKDSDIWVKWLCNRLEPDVDYICTDVRFENELKALKQNGFITVRVERPIVIEDGIVGHPSENEQGFLWDWDYTLMNTKDFNYYYNQLDNLYKKINTP